MRGVVVCGVAGVADVSLLALVGGWGGVSDFTLQRLGYGICVCMSECRLVDYCTALQ